MSDFKPLSGDRLGDKLPVCDTTDPAQLEAWYGNFGYADHWRSVVLSNCREIVRASMSAMKLTEAKIDDLARTHPLYIDFLIRCLDGRKIREQNVRSMMGAV